MNNIKFLIIIICLASCTNSQKENFSEHSFRQNDVDIYIKASTDNKDIDQISSVVNNFSGNFTIYPNKQVAFSVILSKSKYIESINFETDSLNSNNIKVNSEISYSLNELPSIQESNIKSIYGNYNFFIIKCPLKIKQIDFSVLTSKKVNFKKINFKLINKSNYIPKNSFPVIRKKFVKNDNVYFSDNKTQEKYELEILHDLIYYALLGNKKAESLFLNYRPKQADSGEVVSDLIAGYEETKKNK